MYVAVNSAIFLLEIGRSEVKLVKSKDIQKYVEEVAELNKMLWDLICLSEELLNL